LKSEVYKKIDLILKKSYDDEDLVKCMVNDFRKNRFADTLDADHILGDGFSLANEIKSYEERAKLKCDIGIFIQSPIGILIILVALLVVTILFCCLLRRLCWS
jgi:hypothetical protein